MDHVIAGVSPGQALPVPGSSKAIEERELQKETPAEEPRDGFMHGLRELGHKIDDYTKPHIITDEQNNFIADTTGNRTFSSIGDALKSVAISSFFTTGPAGIPAAMLGSAVGVKAGELTGSRIAAAIAAAVASGAAGAATAALIGGPVAVAGFAITSAFNGAIGALYGSRKASAQDGVCGGALLGALTMGPTGALVGSVSSGIGGGAVDDAGRAVLGAVAGVIIGGAVGAMAGPAGILAGAIKGGLVGGGGAVIGPRIKQAARNLQKDLRRYLDKKLSPKTGEIKVRRWQKVALGALSGMLPYAFMGGLLFRSPIAAAVGATIGGVIGAKAMYSTMKKPAEPAQEAAALPDEAVKTPVNESDRAKTGEIRAESAPSE